jgi:hypothetical protein
MILVLALHDQQIGQLRWALTPSSAFRPTGRRFVLVIWR